MCELAISLIGCFISFPVAESKTVTIRVIPHTEKNSLMESLYFCADMNGNNLPFLSTPLYFSTSFLALSFKGTFTVAGSLDLVLRGM